MSTIEEKELESVGSPEYRKSSLFVLTSRATFETIDGNNAILDGVCDSCS